MPKTIDDYDAAQTKAQAGAALRQLVDAGSVGAFDAHREYRRVRAMVDEMIIHQAGWPFFCRVDVEFDGLGLA